MMWTMQCLNCAHAQVSECTCLREQLREGGALRSPVRPERRMLVVVSGVVEHW